ncbi:LuxR C-terminal-related transcriptional regulator [Noviherbaspirillum aerium]|uniref:LuxR C-terminal-related transcriptional regulator n=1 Tax=Noviherbaspirillum aerium TaxID=2588497 RepID=UPI00124F5CA0|nr:response regulator transcription factor [Noviherbaspirillum aerium]
MILIATTDSILLSRCNQGLKGNGTVIAASEPDYLCETVRQLKPALLLIDFQLIGYERLQSISRIQLASPRTRILALNVFADERTEFELLKSGVRGCCASDASPEQIGRAAFALVQGEYWIRRSLMSRLVEQHLTTRQERQPSPADLCILMQGLTERESQIARLVGQGNNNKQIARMLEITERTVKSHLTEIFRKVGVSDRLSLALRISGAASHATPQPDSDIHDSRFRPWRDDITTASVSIPAI